MSQSCQVIKTILWYRKGPLTENVAESCNCVIAAVHQIGGKMQDVHCVVFCTHNQTTTVLHKLCSLIAFYCCTQFHNLAKFLECK